MSCHGYPLVQAVGTILILVACFTPAWITQEAGSASVQIGIFRTCYESGDTSECEFWEPDFGDDVKVWFENEMNAVRGLVAAGVIIAMVGGGLSETYVRVASSGKNYSCWLYSAGLLLVLGGKLMVVLVVVRRSNVT